MGLFDIKIHIHNNLIKRIVSAILLAPIMILPVLYGGISFQVLILFMSLAGIYEWHNMIRHVDDNIYQRWSKLGLIYVGLFAVSILYLRNIDLNPVLCLVLSIWATDIGAYFCGKIIGGKKILPSVSPNKTWAGLIGGALAAGLVNILLGLFFLTNFSFLLFFTGVYIAIIAQIGDFFESWVKRRFDVKDSGNLIPGHGGILDRIDGFMFITPILALVALLSGGEVTIWK